MSDEPIVYPRRACPECSHSSDAHDVNGCNEPIPTGHQSPPTWRCQCTHAFPRHPRVAHIYACSHCGTLKTDPMRIIGHNLPKFPACDHLVDVASSWNGAPGHNTFCPGQFVLLHSLDLR